MNDLSIQLREHAARVASGGPGDSDYDPETLELEYEAADYIEALESDVKILRQRVPDRDDIERCIWLMERYGTDVWSKLRVDGIIEALTQSLDLQ